MHPSRRIAVAGAATIALALTAIVAPPASAANESRVTFVNGIAGKAIDICLNGQEAKSGLKYGAATSRVRDNGSYNVKVFKKDPRKCKGTKLGQTTIDLSFEDLTVVATKRFPKIIVFDDTTLTTAPPNGYIAWRNASDLGPVAIKYLFPTPIGPAVDPVWTKGDQFVTTLGPNQTYGILATRPDQAKILAGPKFQTVATGRRHEWILVGNKGKNAKIATFDRPFWAVP